MSSFSFIHFKRSDSAASYLLNVNILAARIFLTQFISLAIKIQPSLKSSLQPTPIGFPVQGAASSDTDEIIFTTDSTLNFLQLAVRLCQRAQADRSKQAREAWIRLCGIYQNKGGVFAQGPVKEVSPLSFCSSLLASNHHS